MTGKHLVSVVTVFLFLLVATVMAYSWQRTTQKPALPDPVDAPVVAVPAPVSKERTLTGLPLCLPQKNPDSPQTEECVLGFRTENGEYYALDFERMPKPLPDVSRGEVLTLAGEVTPLAVSNTSRFERYEASHLFFATSVIMAPALSSETTQLP
jgi:hypothetical protein